MKALVILLSILTSFLAFGQNANCEPLKKGKYYYYAPNGGVVTVIRKRKKQIERYNNENQKFTFSITPIDSCTYNLTLIKAKGVDKIQQANILGKKVKIEIISAGLDEYKLVIAENTGGNKNSLTLYKN